MFGDWTQGTLVASSRARAMSASESPVVPTTAATPAWLAASRFRMAAAGAVKSRRTWAPCSALSTTSTMATPSGPTPATSPASRPTSTWSLRSTAPTIWKSGLSRMRATRRLPIRPEAPATTALITAMPPLALRIPGKDRAAGGGAPLLACGLDESVAILRQEPVVPEGGLQFLPVGVRHRAQRQAEFLPDLAHPGQGRLHRDGVGLDEHGLAEREEPQMQLPRPLPVPVEEGMGHVGHILGYDVGDDGDDPTASHRHQGESQGIVAGEEAQLVSAQDDVLGHLVQAARGLLHPDDVGVVRQLRQRLGQHVDAGPAGDVIEDQ